MKIFLYSINSIKVTNQQNKIVNVISLKIFSDFTMKDQY